MKTYNKQILIVDDEIFNINAIKLIIDCVFGISKVDNVCDMALNGEEAVKKVEKNVLDNNGLHCSY